MPFSSLAEADSRKSSRSINLIDTVYKFIGKVLCTKDNILDELIILYLLFVDYG